MAPLRIDWKKSPYRAMIGTGGIGSGLFFAMKGNHTLGREESRAGLFLDRRDYCKLHIIAHYVKMLLGPDFPTLLIGAVGDDQVGRQLLAEMTRTGLDTRYVAVNPADRTMLSVVFVYPDGSGGNLTPEDSACSRVGPASVAQAEADFARFSGRGIALAAPEVPLEARQALLQRATRHGFFRVGSFVSAEVQPAVEMGLLGMLDLLALNIDEAAVAAGIPWEPHTTGETSPEAVIQPAVERLSAAYPGLKLSLTAGKQGSWSWDGSCLIHQPAYPTTVVSTAGAGDAHIAGIIAGLAAGLTLAPAQALGGLVAALSVTSPHTIAPDVERDALRRFAEKQGIELEPVVAGLLQA